MKALVFGPRTFPLAESALDPLTRPKAHHGRVRLFTVGHGARPFEELTEILASAGVVRLADARRFPGSRHSPQFAREALERGLGETGIAYRSIPRLGGRRPKGPDPSPNSAWRVEGFRNYADYMDTPEFAAGLEELLAFASEGVAAVMCAEVHPSRCHRRLVADKLWSLGHEVVHLIEPGRLEAHVPPTFLRVEAGRLRYDLPVDEEGQARLL